LADPNVVRAFKKAIRVRHAGPKVQQALFEAGITESGLRNLNYGDRDSKGPLQQRASTGWKHATDPYRAALDFLAQAQPLNQRGFKGSAGQLAQAVQRSAFPARYDQNAAQAARFLQGVQAGSGGSSTRTTTQSTSVTPDAQQAQRAALAQFVLSNRPDPLALAENYAALGQQTQTTTRVRTSGTSVSQGSGTPSAKAPTATGTVNFDGKPVAAWIAPALAYARQHGWKGRVNSGYRSFAEQTRIYNSGVRPAAKPGTSNHEGTKFPRGAVDVSDAQGLSRILQGSKYAHLLVWAGAKDPPHLSHPHNGSY
jgi:hypothetical protein